MTEQNTPGQFYTVPLSVLDLATIIDGKSPDHTFYNSLDLARHAESFGYKRYWLAEHHNMESTLESCIPGG